MQQTTLMLAPGQKEEIEKKLDMDEIPEEEQDEVEYIATVPFQNGCELVIKLCSGSSNYFLDLVLFGSNGYEMCCSALDSLPDVIEIEHDEEEYVVAVKEAEAA